MKYILLFLISLVSFKNKTVKKQEPVWFNGNTLYAVKDIKTIGRYRYEVFYNELLPSEKNTIDSLKNNGDIEYLISWEFGNSCCCDSATYFKKDHRIFFPLRNSETYIPLK